MRRRSHLIGASLEDDGFADRHIVRRYVLVEAGGARLDVFYFVDSVGAVGDLAEYGVAPRIARRFLEVEERVVGDVDEEL